MGENINPGAGKFETVSVRGVGFAPSKEKILVIPPDVTPETLDDYLAQAEYPVADYAIQAVLDRKKDSR